MTVTHTTVSADSLKNYTCETSFTLRVATRGACDILSCSLFRPSLWVGCAWPDEGPKGTESKHTHSRQRLRCPHKPCDRRRQLGRCLGGACASGALMRREKLCVLRVENAVCRAEMWSCQGATQHLTTLSLGDLRGEFPEQFPTLRLPRRGLEGPGPAMGALFDVFGQNKIH